MSLKRKILALTIGTMTLLSAQAPAFADFTNESDYTEVGNTKCKITVICEGDTCYTEAFCKDSVDEIKVHTRAYSKNYEAASKETSEENSKSCDDSDYPAKVSGGEEVKSADGWGEFTEGDSTVQIFME